MTQIDDQAGTPAAAQQTEDLEVRVARELLDRAKAEGVSLVGPGRLLAGVTKTVLQAALDAEMADHLGYEKGERPPFPSGNHRNGTSPKTVLTEVGPIPLEVARDRVGKFDPQIVPKHARRVASVRRVRAHLGRPVPGDHRAVAKLLGAIHPGPGFPPGIRKIVYTTNAVVISSPLWGISDVALRAFELRRGRVILSGVYDAPEAVSHT